MRSALDRGAVRARLVLDRRELGAQRADPLLRFVELLARSLRGGRRRFFHERLPASGESLQGAGDLAVPRRWAGQRLRSVLAAGARLGPCSGGHGVRGRGGSQGSVLGERRRIRCRRSGLGSVATAVNRGGYAVGAATE